MMEEIRELINEYKKDLPKEWRNNHAELAEYMVNNLLIELPKPETDTIEQRMEAFDKFADSIDKVLDSYFYEDAMSLINDEEAQDRLDKIKAAVRYKELRDFVKRRAILPELDYLESWDESKGPLDQFTKESINYVKKLRALLKRNVDKFFEEPDDDYDSGDEMDDDSFDSDSGDDDMGGGDDDLDNEDL
jgi:hypothetical protein